MKYFFTWLTAFFFFCPLFGTEVEKKIAELFFNQKDNITYIIGFEDFLIKQLAGEKNINKENLTGKLFFYLLEMYLPASIRSTPLVIKVYPLKEIYSFRRKNQDDPVKAFHFMVPEKEIILDFLVKFTSGKGYPEERLLYLPVRKWNDTFVIEAGATIFGDKCFYAASGIQYDPNTKKLNWNDASKEAFIEYCRDREVIHGKK